MAGRTSGGDFVIACYRKEYGAKKKIFILAQLWQRKVAQRSCVPGTRPWWLHALVTFLDAETEPTWQEQPKEGFALGVSFGGHMIWNYDP